MSKENTEIRYAESHEWARWDGDGIVTIGVSDYAQGNLGDVTFVELPDTGDSFEKGDSFGVVESVKAASDLYAPVAGEVTETNETLDESPDTVNQDPLGEGWMIRLSGVSREEWETLLSSEDYAAKNGSGED
ncbi:MAG: glycine cleavage system protein GcvH [Opitutales bacterium]|nr:glycine cleavage system protein GcvH [Opitutales bacterium]